MKKLLTYLAAVAAFTGSVLAEPVNKACPISGKDIDKAKTSTYSKKVAFCCEKCEGKYTAEPDKFVKEIAESKADGKCIMSGKAGDKSAEYKREVAFCCDKCKAKFDAEPDKYIAKAVKK